MFNASKNIFSIKNYMMLIQIISFDLKKVVKLKTLKLKNKEKLELLKLTLQIKTYT